MYHTSIIVHVVQLSVMLLTPYGDVRQPSYEGTIYEGEMLWTKEEVVSCKDILHKVAPTVFVQNSTKALLKLKCKASKTLMESSCDEK